MRNNNPNQIVGELTTSSHSNNNNNNAATISLTFANGIKVEIVETTVKNKVAYTCNVDLTTERKDAIESYLQNSVTVAKKNEIKCKK